jgi:hypothetical protein
MILRNNKGQVAGELRDGIYRKVVDSKRHKMKIYNAYGVDLEILEKMRGQCEKVRLLEKDTKNIYETSYESFLKNGIQKNYDGKQVFLPLKFWMLENRCNLSLFG